ncbi:hypothetical protein V499_04085 [Pseudogymnoascus sp. VKM F-103]|nr:hypothetical protein V499_04085 [Pseudogymnoascus sp. VKM F-103]
MAPGFVSDVNIHFDCNGDSNLPNKLEPLCQIVTPIGMFGYGFDESITRKALQGLVTRPTPTALILDSGSTDGGPLKLAVGSMTTPRSAYQRDFRKLLALSHEFKVPVIIASAGGDGADAHVDEFLNIIQEITEEEANSAYAFKTLAIYSNVTKSKVLKSLHDGEVVGCGISVPSLTAEDVHNASTIVAQIGPEPFIDAMAAETDFDIIISGRAYDPSPYIAFCVHQSNQKLSSSLESLRPENLGGYAFMGKIMECGALCGTPKSSSAMATIYRDGTFDIVPLSPEARCTPSSVAAHTLYEKCRPDILPGPGGNLELSNSVYTQLPDNRTVRVSGAHFQLSRSHYLPYTVKLEAAKSTGYRSIIMGGIRDPILIGQIDDFLTRIKEFVKQQHKEAAGTWEMDFHVYGARGIMGALEPGDPTYKPREIFLVGEALASSQELATGVASSARIACVHGPYPGQRGTSGNFAMGIGGKMEVEMGPCAEFCIYHLIPLSVGEEGARQIQDPAADLVNGETQDEGDVGTQKPLFSWKKLQIGRGKVPKPSLGKNGMGAALISPPYKALKAPPPSVTNLNFVNPLTLYDIAPVIRSKNAGPYDITLDVLFSHRSIYDLVKSSDLLTPAVIGGLYHLKEEEIIYCGFYDQAMAWKATVPRKGLRHGIYRRVASGSYMEADVHGSQQYVGLMQLELTREVREGIRRLDIDQ